MDPVTTSAGALSQLNKETSVSGFAVDLRSSRSLNHRKGGPKLHWWFQNPRKRVCRVCSGSKSGAVCPKRLRGREVRAHGRCANLPRFSASLKSQVV